MVKGQKTPAGVRDTVGIAAEQVLMLLGAMGCDPRRNGRGWVALCPAHDDSDFSLAIRPDGPHRSVLRCSAGCSFESVITAMMPAIRDSAPRSKRPRIALSDLFHDFYHATRIVELHGRNIRYNKKLGGFLVWNGARWVVDEAGTVWQWAIETTRTVYHEEADKPDGGEIALKKWAVRANRRKRVEAALKQLQMRPAIVATPDMFDRDPWLLNVSNGTIDLRTGTLREHRREDMITKLAPVEFDPAAAPPERWLRFLDEIFDGNKELSGFVQRVCGYALTGLVGERKLFFLNGRGSNGKTTFLSTLTHVMGEYAVRLAPGLLFGVRRGAHRARYSDLKGARLAVMADIEFGRKLSEAAVKELTGADRLAGGRTLLRSFPFEPTHTLFVCGDHLPLIRGNEKASWERIVLIPFQLAIPKERQDRDLRDTLRAEASGILNWLVAGCLEWQRTGLAEPAEVTDAVRSYRSDADILGNFIDECCVLEPGRQESSGKLHTAFNEWRARNGERPIGTRAFGMEMKERGFVQTRVGAERVRTWMGIGLKRPPGAAKRNDWKGKNAFGSKS